MRRASVLILTALSPLLFLTPLRAYAGIAFMDTVSSCPAVIKNVITVEMLLSDDFAPWDITDGMDKVNTVDTINTVVIINTDTIGIIDTINTVTTVDTAGTVVIIDTSDISDDERARAVPSTSLRDQATRTVAERRSLSEVEGSRSDWTPDNAKKIKMKFGRRAAFNHSRVSNVLIRVYKHDGDDFTHYEYGNQASFGIGFEVAGVIDWVFSDVLALNVSPGVIFRKPINTAVVGTSEVALSIPVLAEWGPFGGVAAKPSHGASQSDAFTKPWGSMYGLRQLRLFGGFCIGVPVYAWVKWNGEESSRFKDRSAADFGLVGGVGLYVSDRAFVDVRGIFGITGYDGVDGRRLNQLAIGVNYVK
ncbi:MAG: hypothetical protein LBC59_05475 [Chitinispirillales bacterium]|jgi:hypothetical protein|nr:hypothetical protein [Chitinispirillales bacterium]